MIPAFPKIFSIGTKQTQDLFHGEVEITEKIDGSQIGFGVINGELIIRSKGCRIYPENVDKMFKAAVDVIMERKELLEEGFFYYGEYLRSNKHNILVYDQIPKNHIALYGFRNIEKDLFISYEFIKNRAKMLDLDIVPLLFQGKIESKEELKENLNRISFLGKAKIEGLVVKNYNKELLIGGQVIPILMGKYVSEDFKEVHNKEWKSCNTGNGKFDVYKSQFCNTARWNKAIQHLRDRGELTQSLKDIGPLLKEINVDIMDEEQDNIKTWLWNNFGKEVLREACRGFPEYYKEYLLKGCDFSGSVSNEMH